MHTVSNLTAFRLVNGNQVLGRRKGEVWNPAFTVPVKQLCGDIKHRAILQEGVVAHPFPKTKA